MAAFGEPLSPTQVVEKICAEVAAKGLPAVLDFTRRLDGVTLEPGSIRVSEGELRRGLLGRRPALLEDAGKRPPEHPGVPAGDPPS